TLDERRLATRAVGAHRRRSIGRRGEGSRVLRLTCPTAAVVGCAARSPERVVAAVLDGRPSILVLRPRSHVIVVVDPAVRDEAVSSVATPPIVHRRRRLLGAITIALAPPPVVGKLRVAVPSGRAPGMLDYALAVTVRDALPHRLAALDAM